MSIILLGYRGCGKTSIGRRLADQLWQPFVDTDELIVQTAGKTIREIFEEQGEAEFRDLETAALRDVVDRPDTVISIGGGAILREENRAMLKATKAARIYLRCEPTELHRRIAADPSSAANRPALTQLGGAIAEVEAMLRLREPLYRETMTAELEVTHLSVAEAAVYAVKLM